MQRNQHTAMFEEKAYQHKQTKRKIPTQIHIERGKAKALMGRWKKESALIGKL
jgi:hypothetical protein